MGSVQRATAPKPTSKTLLGKVSVVIGNLRFVRFRHGNCT